MQVLLPSILRFEVLCSRGIPSWGIEEYLGPRIGDRDYQNHDLDVATADPLALLLSRWGIVEYRQWWLGG
jgi:hypothetical protein